MGLEIALLVTGALIFAGVVFYSLRDPRRSLRSSLLNPEQVEGASVSDSGPAASPPAPKPQKVEKVRAVVAARTRKPGKPVAEPVRDIPAESEKDSAKLLIEEPASPVPPVPEEPRPIQEAEPVAGESTVAAVPGSAKSELKEDESISAVAGERVGERSKEHTRVSAAAADKSELEIDFVARIKIGKSVIRDEILGVYRQHEFDFDKPSKVFGLNELTNLWCDLELEINTATFSQIGASIQLADKNGPITEDELNRFSQMMLTMADSLNRPFRFSMEFEEALERAAHLDQLGQRYDAMAVLNIIARQRSGFRAIDIESCARDLNMYKDLKGIYVRADANGSDSGRAIYRMAPADERGHLIGDRTTEANVKDLVLYLNVPATRDPEQVFHRMMEDARSLAEWLDGKIIDQHGRHMTARGFKMITRQIRDISQEMKIDGLKPGDVVSSKLY